MRETFPPALPWKKRFSAVYSEDELIPLSALQHLLFCERQCALIHIEQIWVENRYTAEGRVMHERVHTAAGQSRGMVRIEYSVPRLKRLISPLCPGMSARSMFSQGITVFSCP